MIDILIVKDTNGERLEWLFERDIGEEATQFRRAKELALKAGVYLGERNDDFISYADEFESWVLLNGPAPDDEDDLTKLVRKGVDLNAKYEEVRQRRTEANKEADALYGELQEFVKTTKPLIGKVKVVDGESYTRGLDGTIVKLEQA